MRLPFFFTTTVFRFSRALSAYYASEEFTADMGICAVVLFLFMLFLVAVSRS